MLCNDTSSVRIMHAYRAMQRSNAVMMVGVRNLASHPVKQKRITLIECPRAWTIDSPAVELHKHPFVCCCFGGDLIHPRIDQRSVDAMPSIVAIRAPACR
eukprot:gnl/TRDRNA2_/TRDRNA2_174305_c2_seq2.p1 gnl/TRDRNA2_/TRDRNA2_174305_c2~~gnl/TRDRNA2_/TRDRNA2_174305_c2_seq2.p1  ORF type:complete len:100 (+),score=0.43 gnl/TRDRNA2_/TRDRNA2_174305_c2_seq2:42-341(+)